MLATLRPLFPYLRRYRRDFIWGGLVAVLANAIWIFFPQVIRIAIDDLNHGVTRQKIFRYAWLLVGFPPPRASSSFLPAGSSSAFPAKLSSTCATISSAIWSGNRQPTFSNIGPATSWPA